MTDQLSGSTRMHFILCDPMVSIAESGNAEIPDWTGAEASAHQRQKIPGIIMDVTFGTNGDLDRQEVVATLPPLGKK